MKNIKAKFEQLIRGLHYDQLKFTTLDVEKIKDWSYVTMPGVVREMEQLGWDMSNDTTWLENTFSNHVLVWYGKRVAVFITTSMYEFALCRKVLQTKAFAKFRETFDLDLHVSLLVHPVIFLRPEDLDDLYVSFDWDKKWSAIDYSHYDEEGELEEGFSEEWGWLEYSEDTTDEWNADQVSKAYKEEVYSYSE